MQVNREYLSNFNYRYTCQQSIQAIVLQIYLHMWENDVYAQLMTLKVLIVKDWEGCKYAFENNWLPYDASIHCQCRQKQKHCERIYLSIWNISQETFSERSHIQIFGAIRKRKRKYIHRHTGTCIRYGLPWWLRC